MVLVQGERGRCLCSDACLAGNARAGSECAVLGVSPFGGRSSSRGEGAEEPVPRPRVLWGVAEAARRYTSCSGKSGSGGGACRAERRPGCAGVL